MLLEVGVASFFQLGQDHLQSQGLSDSRLAENDHGGDFLGALEVGADEIFDLLFFSSSVEELFFGELFVYSFGHFSVDVDHLLFLLKQLVDLLCYLGLFSGFGPSPFLIH